MLRGGGNIKLLSATLMIAVAFFLRYKFGAALGFWPDFVLATLIAYSLFLTFFELIFMISLSVLLFHWQPVPGIEIFLFFILPLSLFFFRKIVFPIEGWASTLGTVGIGILVFYAVSSFYFAFKEGSSVLFVDLVVSMAFGLFVFQFFRWFHGVDSRAYDEQ